jgi:hypothetical protein
MTYTTGGGAPRNPEVARQFAAEKQRKLLAEGAAHRQAHEARRGWLRRLFRRGTEAE